MPHLGSSGRFESVGQEIVKIINDHSKLALTTDPSARIGDKSWVWLEAFTGWDCQLWRLDPTDDRVAFEIRSKQGSYALDAGKGGFV